MTSSSAGPTIWLRRKTDLLTDADVARIANACNIQVIRDLAPVWYLLPRAVRVIGPRDRVPTGDQLLELLDASDESGALGYHTELAGDVVWGVVGVGTILDNGGKKFTGSLSVSSIVSHEVCEMVVNPNVSGWSDSGQGWLVATEVCDPVQSSAYKIGDVPVSDFVTPDFFSPVVTRGDRFDHMGVLKKPFQIAKGGYVLNYEGGKINTYYGAVPPPEWLMDMKLGRDTSRTRRLQEHRPS